MVRLSSIVALAVVLGVLGWAVSWAQRGDGGYDCVKVGKKGYKCVKGPLAGQSFASQEAMVKALRGPAAGTGSKVSAQKADLKEKTRTVKKSKRSPS